LGIGVRGKGMVIGNKKVALVLLLHAYKVFYRTKVVAQM
jgi:hypothetical protein